VNHQANLVNDPLPVEPPSKTIAAAVGEGVESQSYLQLTSAAAVNAVSFEVSEKVFATVTIKAPELVVEDMDVNTATKDDGVRAPLDLIVVLDVNGSMRGEKLRALQDTMTFLSEQLGARDRLCVTTFSSNAQQHTPFYVMSPQRKLATAAVLSSLRAGGGTNITEGIRVASQALSARETKNKVTAVLLLSDGQDGRARTAAAPYIQDVIVPQGASLHCFGFGADHDAALLQGLAEDGNGTFAYIEDVDTVYEAFGVCLGGLMSVAAQNITLTLTIPDGEATTLAAVHTAYAHQLASDGRRATVTLPDMFWGEARDVLLEVQLSALPGVRRQVCLAASMAYLHVTDGGAEAGGLLLADSSPC
jgi:uncharacterized protein YegL